MRCEGGDRARRGRGGRSRAAAASDATASDRPRHAEIPRRWYALVRILIEFALLSIRIECLLRVDIYYL